MKQILLLILVCPYFSFGQCPPSLTFSSQVQIDSFAIENPDCTETNSLIIEGNDITSLLGINQIVSCGSLRVRNNPLLENLNGLNINLIFESSIYHQIIIDNNSSLLEISDLANISIGSEVIASNITISNNPLLNSLNGLQFDNDVVKSISIINNDALVNLNGLQSINNLENVTIRYNDNLIDLSGLDNLTLCSDRLYIANNLSLQSLNGLSNLQYAVIVNIENNQNLTNIDAIPENAASYPQYLTVANNPNLSFCSTPFVCAFININGVLEDEWLPGNFKNNASGCFNNFEVEYGCGLTSIDNCYHFLESNYLIFGETISVNNEFATTSLQIPSCNEVPNRKDIWFAFVSENLSSIDVIAEAGYSLQLWEETEFGCGNQVQAGSACNNTALIDVPINPNSIYYIQIWDDGTGRRESGWFNLTVQDGLLSVPELALSDIKLYPNPANNILNIQSSSKVDKVSIYNMLGQNILESTYYSNDVSVNISNLSKGMYMAIISIDGREAIYKIIKQ